MTLYLIDGNSYIHRAFHAIPNLTTSKGEQVNAVFGFTKMLLKILSNYKPDHIAVCMDYPAPTFRHKKFPEYKIHRKKTADELKNQFPLVKEIISAFNITIFEKEGYEADDLIATISELAKNKGIDVVIVTSDKDVLQLIDENVKVLNEPKNILYDKCEVVKKLGIPPENVVDYLALSGDSSDNIPGVPGIGEKTAVKLINEFGCLENILKNQTKIKGNSGILIAEHSETANLSKKLVTLVRNIPIDMELEQLKIKQPDNEKLLDILRQLEFYSLIKLLVKEKKQDLEKSDFQIVDSEEQIKSISNLLKHSNQLSFFIAVNKNNSVIGIALSPGKNKSFYIPLEQSMGELMLIEKKQMKVETVFEYLKSIFENDKVLKITHGSKTQLSAFEKMEKLVSVPRELFPIFDVEIASYLLNPSGKNHSLADIAVLHLGLKIDTFEGNYENLEIEEAKTILCKQTDLILKSYEVLQEKLNEKKLLSLFYDIEIPLLRVIYFMEKFGIKIDEIYLKKLSEEFNRELKKLEKIIFSMAGEQFNINSPKQLAHVLFDRMGLTPIKKTKTGFSTGEDVLIALAKTSELPKTILEYREISKLKSTYVDALVEKINPETKRLHTQFNQTVTSTGRLSSSEPNLQNIPIKTERGLEIRRGFIPENGFIFASFDYSQIDLRVLAHITKDKNFCEAFRNGEDIHISTAAEVFGLKKEEITMEMRKRAKGINFGIVYGQQSWGLSQQLGITTEEAQKYIDSYFEKYIGVKLWIDETIIKARENGYVKTLLGRIRYLPDIKSQNAQMRAFAERTAINMPIQGTSADIIKVAMIKINEKLSIMGKNDAMLICRMLLQIHDDLLFEIRKDEIDAFLPMIKHEMEHAVKLDIPVIVDVKIGKNWADLKPQQV